jgi:hypothetical protein
MIMVKAGQLVAHYKEKTMEFSEDVMCTCGHPGADHAEDEPHACRKWECACAVFEYDAPATAAYRLWLARERP